MTPHDKSASGRQPDSRPQGFGLGSVGPDEFSVFMPERRKRAGLATRHILFVGVAGACAMGVGLGLWARPAMTERRAAAAPPADVAKAAPSEHRLQIVVDDRPVPVGPLLAPAPARAEPLPEPEPASAPAPQAPPPELRARPEPTPLAAPQGLTKARAVAEPRAPVVARPKLAPLVVAALLAPKPVPVKAAAPKARPAAQVHLAKAAPDARLLAKAHRLELARAAAAHRIEVAKAAQATAQAAARTAKAAHRQQIELARAEARGRAEARAEARTLALAEARDDAHKRARLMALAHAVQKLLPHAARPAPVQLAKVEARHAHRTRHEPRIEQASLRSRKAAAHVAQPVYRTRAAPPPPQHASGLMKVSATRCANRDPGEAIVCANPSLGAADRQLSRAYQGARAAGVPDAQLQRQQQHWLAARSAAAREAPWVVHDVYLARIAELNGQAREAHPDGY